eukprot:5839053-Karenia_brevis.AAC.1
MCIRDSHSPCGRGYDNDGEPPFDDPADDVDDLMCNVPLDRQQEVDAEAEKWGEVWQDGAIPPACPWPAEMGQPLPPITSM